MTKDGKDKIFAAMFLVVFSLPFAGGGIWVLCHAWLGGPGWTENRWAGFAGGAISCIVGFGLLSPMFSWLQWSRSRCATDVLLVWRPDVTGVPASMGPQWVRCGIGNPEKPLMPENPLLQPRADMRIVVLRDLDGQPWFVSVGAHGPGNLAGRVVCTSGGPVRRVGGIQS